MIPVVAAQNLTPNLAIIFCLSSDIWPVASHPSGSLRWHPEERNRRRPCLYQRINTYVYWLTTSTRFVYLLPISIVCCHQGPRTRVFSSLVSDFCSFALCETVCAEDELWQIRRFPWLVRPWSAWKANWFWRYVTEWAGMILVKFGSDRAPEESQPWFQNNKFWRQTED